MNKTGNTVRIRECGNGHFGLAIIDHDNRKVYDQGLATGAHSPKDAYNYAVQCLPSRVTEKCAWEYRSEAGVYADLDVVKLGWKR